MAETTDNNRSGDVYYSVLCLINVLYLSFNVSFPALAIYAVKMCQDWECVAEKAKVFAIRNAVETITLLLYLMSLASFAGLAGWIRISWRNHWFLIMPYIHATDISLIFLEVWFGYLGFKNRPDATQSEKLSRFEVSMVALGVQIAWGSAMVCVAPFKRYLQDQKRKSKKRKKKWIESNRNGGMTTTTANHCRTEARTSRGYLETHF